MLSKSSLKFSKYPSQNITQEKGRQEESSKKKMPKRVILKGNIPQENIPRPLQMHMFKRDTSLVAQVYGKLF